MNNNNLDCFEIHFLGTTGSCALMNMSKKSSNTLSVLIKVGGYNFIFDAGTGICNLKTDLLEKNDIKLFLSHYHVDHIEGILFWDLIHNPKYNIDIYGHCFENKGVKEVLNSYFKSPFYPVGLESFKADLRFFDIVNPSVINFGNDIEVHTINLSHPNGCTGYRINYGGKSICYLTDIEIALQNDLQALQEFASGANIVIFDTFFDVEEYMDGWGHSSWRQAAEFTRDVNADMLVTYHHNFKMNDTEKARFVNLAKSIHSNTIFSEDGLMLKLI